MKTREKGRKVLRVIYLFLCKYLLIKLLKARNYSAVGSFGSVRIVSHLTEIYSTCFPHYIFSFFAQSLGAYTYKRG
jgi:hypothetical protein